MANNEKKEKERQHYLLKLGFLRSQKKKSSTYYKNR